MNDTSNKRANRNGIFKRGKFYHYRVVFKGRLVSRSTRQSDKEVAKQKLSEARTALSLGKFEQEKPSVPTLREFIEARIRPWSASRPSWKWFESGIRPLLAHNPIGHMTLDRITSETTAGYTAARMAGDIKNGRKPVTAVSVNRELRVLRRILGLAEEWGVIDKVPKIPMAGREVRREKTVSTEDFTKYLLCASPLLADIATVLHDSGLRPDECYRLRWEDVEFVNGRHGQMRVRYGKTAAARRVLPMTLRVRTLLEARHSNQGAPAEGWVFPADTASGRVEHSTLRKAHAAALKLAKVPRFLLYSLRHTFLTRLGLSGCDQFTLCRIAGWSSLAVAAVYVHPNADSVLRAFEQSAMLPAATM